MKSIVTRVVLSFLTLVAMCGVARADGMWVNCNRTSGYYQYFDSATIQVGAGNVGELLQPNSLDLLTSTHLPELCRTDDRTGLTSLYHMEQHPG